MMLRVHYREDEVFLRRMYIVNRNERKSFHPSITALQPRDAVKYFTMCHVRNERHYLWKGLQSCVTRPDNK